MQIDHAALLRRKGRTTFAVIKVDASSTRLAYAIETVTLQLQ